MSLNENNPRRQVLILIAEDSPTQAHHLRHILESEGYEVEHALNGKLALQAAQRRRPTLIISDVVMPEMDGYELCGRIKSDPQFKNVPVILVTTLSDPGDVIRGLECRADNFILKPYNQRYLLEHVNFVLLNAQMDGKEQSDAGVDVVFNSQRHRIVSDRHQILSLLLSTYDAAMQRNRDLSLAQEELRAINKSLAERTRELQAARDQADQANRAKSTFLANMSHELRTPLNAITLYTQLLQDEAADRKLGTQFSDDLRKIRMATDHLLRLINDLLDLSKIEAGKFELLLETVDARSTFGEIAEEARNLVEQNKNTFFVLLADELGDIRTDRTRLRQCIYNLLSNAGKFTEKGRVTMSVARVTEKDQPWFVIEVTDTGPGMTPEQVGRIFQDFTQGDMSVTRKFGGTGLGLAITKRFCALMGGNVGVRSQAGKGSTFTMRLPVSTPDQVPSRPAAVPDAITRENTDGRDAVLIIDDEPLSCEAISRFLEKEGLFPLVATSGKQGLELARRHKVVAITLDVRMPEMDGWSVLAFLKADPVLSGVPVIMVTVVDDKPLGLSLGASEYLTKPIARDQLVELIDKYRTGPGVRRALVVDDDPAMRQLAYHILTRENWQVTVAENGREGLAHLETVKPDLILLDLLMPVMDGFEFLSSLQANPVVRRIPVVIMTAKDLTREEREVIAGRVDKVVAKSVKEPENLLYAIIEMARTRRAPENTGR